MDAYVNEMIEIIKNALNIYPPVVSMFLGLAIVFLESIIPILPLCVFVALNVFLFGNILGIFLSYIGTVIGCMVSYHFFKYFMSDMLHKKIKNERLKNLIHTISNMNFSTLVVMMAFPFTPAFSINIAAGLSKMDYHKFLLACLIGKLPMIYFWGYIGTTLIESLTNPNALINIVLLLVVAYIVSKIFRKKFNI